MAKKSKNCRTSNVLKSSSDWDVVVGITLETAPALERLLAPLTALLELEQVPVWTMVLEQDQAMENRLKIGLNGILMHL